MATTRTYSGSVLVDLIFRQVLSGDGSGGSQTPTLKQLKVWNDSGGTAPHFAGWLYGTLTVSAGDILLAHASDPFGSMGASVYSDGLDPAGKKLKLLYIRNTHATLGFTVARKTTNGLPVFLAASDGLTLTAGGIFLWQDWAGSVTGALTSGANDALALSPTSGSPTAEVLAVYGT